MQRLIFKLSVSICVALFATSTTAQTNLLLNPDAANSVQDWRVVGQATVEDFSGSKVFVVRNNGSFWQDVTLSKNDVGKYALLIGHGSSERINPDGAITGLPYLYGYMLRSKTENGATINAYLQGQMMRARASVPDAWVTMYGIFRVPENTVAIRFFLSQAERKNVPQNGSAARFDNVGLYLFKTEQDALKFVKAYEVTL